MELNKAQNRINNTKRYMDKFSVSEAYWYLTRVFTGDIPNETHAQQLKVKEGIVYALNVIMQEKLGLPDGSVKIKIKKLPNDSTAELRDLLGDNIFWLQINMSDFDKSSVDLLIYSILHEYGHINQTLIEQAGGVAPQAISIGPGYDDLSDKGKLGVDFKYQMNLNEADANLFAYKTYLELLDSVHKKLRNKRYKEFKKNLQAEFKFRHGLQMSGSIKYKIWRLFNMRADLEDAYYLDRISRSLPERIYERNLLYKRDLDKELVGLTKKLVQAQTPEYEEVFSGMDDEMKLDESIMLVDGMMASFAKKHDIPIELLGIARGFAESAEAVKFQKVDIKNCPLIGYFMVDRKVVYSAKSPQKIIKSMQKALKVAEAHIKEQPQQ